MKKTVFIVCVLMIFTGVGRADIFDTAADLDAKLYNALSADSAGYNYRSGVDYNIPTSSRNPKVSTSTNLSLGCSGFDFSSNFKNQFSMQVASDLLKNVSAEAMAAAPMLLLEYVSPTLADTVKHFNSLANLKLGLRYAQCEDIEKTVSGEFDKLRKKSEYECLKAKASDDIDTAISECKDQSDPFGFLKNYEGINLSEGIEINVFKDALERLGINADEKESASEIVSETVVSKDGVTTEEAEVTIKEALDKSREEFFEKIDLLVDQYLDNGTVTEAGMKEISVPGTLFNEHQLRNIAMLDDEERYISIAKISSELAYFGTLEKYETVSKLLLKAMTLPNTDEVYLNILKAEYNEVQGNIAVIKSERERIEEYNKVMVHILDEANRKRLETLILDDGTRVFSIKAAGEEDKALMMIPD